MCSHRLRIRDAVRVVQIELAIDLIQIAKFGQRRQLIERLQAEIIEKLACRPIQGGPARDVAVTDHTHPFALHQGLDDIRTHRHTTDILDLTTRDRLAICDQCQRLHQCPRITCRPLVPQPRYPGRAGGTDLNSPTAGDLRNLDSAALIVGGKLLQHRTQLFLVGALDFVEQILDRFQRQRPARCQQCSLDNILEFSRFRHR